jgi:hypothetical protein
MSEVEIHAESDDTFGQRVGIFIGVVGILLAGATILGHREHTAAILEKTDANDQWSYYEAKKIKKDGADTAVQIVRGLGGDSAAAAAAISALSAESARYEGEAESLKHKAGASEVASKHAEDRAVYFDLAEGLLEFGVVLSSLYFLSKRRFFVAIGVPAALVGAAFGVLALFT